MIRPILVVAACLLPSVAAAEPDALFDVVCTGLQQTEDAKPPIAWKERMRFDLESRRWCRGACKSAAPIANVTTDEIQISDSRAGTGGPADVQLTLSRTDGVIREAVMVGWSGSSYAIAEGKCVREPFTGLPKRQF